MKPPHATTTSDAQISCLFFSNADGGIIEPLECKREHLYDEWTIISVLGRDVVAEDSAKKGYIAHLELRKGRARYHSLVEAKNGLPGHMDHAMCESGQPVVNQSQRVMGQAASISV